MPDDDRVWEEIERLRDWRHKEVIPALASQRGRLRALEVRMDAVEPEVERMASQEKIQQAVGAALHERRGEWLTGWQKLGAALVGAVAVADFVRGLIMG